MEKELEGTLMHCGKGIGRDTNALREHDEKSRVDGLDERPLCHPVKGIVLVDPNPTRGF